MRKKNKSLSFICMLGVFLLVLSACGTYSQSGSASSNKNNKTLRLIETDDITSMDSKLATDGISFTAQNQVFEGLYSRNKKGVIVPAVAASQPTTNKAKTIYTFKLRKNAKWSDGSNVTANDFVYAWRAIVDPKTGSQYSYLFDGLIKNADAISKKQKTPDQLGIKALDKYTLQVTLERATPYFESLLVFPVFFPQKEAYVKKQGKQYAQSSSHMIYNGAYVLKNWDTDSDSWAFEKNKYYWDKKIVKTNKIKVEAVKNPGTAANLFTTGKTDRAPLTGEYAKQYRNNKSFISNKQSFVYYIKISEKSKDGKKSELANANFRKALALSVEKTQITKNILADGSIPINGLVPAGLVKDPKTGEDFRKKSGEYLTYDVKKAQSYWTKAQKELGVKSVALTLLNDDQGADKQTAEYLQNQWEKHLPGIKISLRTVPYKNRLSLDQNGDFQLELTRWGPDYADPSTYTDLFKKDNKSYNTEGYANSKYDQLVNDAETKLATAPEERLNNFIKAEKVLLQDDAAIVPLYQNAAAVLQKSYVKDYIVYPNDLTYYKFAYIQK